ncbi:hypothetical protein ACFY7H_14445 [Streptomyces sp. NPDC012794]|uniref:hypothetical protein n=1 Tax=Streptomyces sp. NPDC012794 TaxID=3364850 RepID=UPI0036A7FD4E
MPFGPRRVAPPPARSENPALGAEDADEGAQGHERVTLAMVDLPLSVVVRRHPRVGGPLPPHAEDLAEECAAALL